MTLQIFFSASNEVSSSENFVREVLKWHYGMERDQLRICPDELGKPFLVGVHDVHFNISNVSGAIICAISDLPVGIDIERERQVNIRIMNKFFTREERDYVLADSNNQEERFTRVWTMKEAYVKWDGTGLNDSIASLNVLALTTINCFRFNDFYISVCSEYITLNQMPDCFKIFPLTSLVKGKQLSDW